MLKTSIIVISLLVAVQQPKPLSFEAAALKPSDTRNGVGTFFTRPGGRIDASGCTLEFLIMIAYGVDQYHIGGGPSWVRQDYFSTTAVPPPKSHAAKYIPKDPKTFPPAD